MSTIHARAQASAGAKPFFVNILFDGYDVQELRAAISAKFGAKNGVVKFDVEAPEDPEGSWATALQVDLPEEGLCAIHELGYAVPLARERMHDPQIRPWHYQRVAENIYDKVVEETQEAGLEQTVIGTGRT